MTYTDFRDQWLTDILAGKPSTTDKGHRFAHKMLTQWLYLDDSSDNLYYCDGAGDGGIDIAYLHKGEGDETDADGEGEPEGDTWYLLQSKYGSAFQGSNTLLEEGHKVIVTLTGERKILSSISTKVLELLTNFRQSVGEHDRIVLVFATVDPLSKEENETLGYVRAMGQKDLGLLFDVVPVSLETLHQQTLKDDMTANKLSLSLKANLSASGQGLMVGPVPLSSLYDFLKAYRARTQDLDRLYEKNVRRFLGSRGRINKGIEKTLRETPELFGLYNNGITIVVTDFATQDDGTINLTDPYVVNGCQTTRTIWEVFQRKLESGGKGQDADLESWKEHARQGVVVTKIARVGMQGEGKMEAITRFTNSQNAVREKDFLALGSKSFETWVAEMAQRYNVFLEIQRGGWDSQLALQKQKPTMTPKFSEYANAFDLLKVYSAGWMGEAGTAFGKNNAFLPNGAVYKRIFDPDAGDNAFDVDDLYAAYRLQRAADGFKFGRGAVDSRRQTRFLFYMVALDLLKDIMVRAGIPITRPALSKAMLTLFKPGNAAASDTWLEAAIDTVDSYMTLGTDSSVHTEPQLTQKFNSDLNGFLKWEQLGKSEEATPRLRTLLTIAKAALGSKIGQHPSRRDMIIAAIKGP